MSGKMSNCKHCGCAIIWKQTKDGWRPLNAVTGDLHFQECRTTRFKKSGRPLVSKGIVVIGENYKPSGCDCGIPPWEVCEHSFQWAKDEDDLVLDSLDRMKVIHGGTPPLTE